MDDHTKRPRVVECSALVTARGKAALRPLGASVAPPRAVCLGVFVDWRRENAVGWHATQTVPGAASAPIRQNTAPGEYVGRLETKRQMPWMIAH